MLGYIKIYENELKIKNIRMYKDMYCGLCTKLGKDFGFLHRLFVSYDATFFLLLFNALSEKKEYAEIKCPFNPKIKKQLFISDKAIEYVSLISLYILIQKNKDDEYDEEYNCKNLINKWLLNNKKITKKIHYYGNILESWNDLMDKYYIAEKDSTSNFDELINNIGGVYGKVFSDYLNFADIDADEEMLYDLGFNIGSYIYLMDAYDDYFKDIKKNRFNPIMRMNDYDEIKNNNNKIRRKVEVINVLLLNKINSCALNLKLHEKNNSEIIENIIIYGMNNIYTRITREKYIEGACTKCHN